MQKSAYTAFIILCAVGIFTFLNYLRIESKARIWPKIDEVIQIEINDGVIPFQVLDYDAETKVINLVSLDEYGEKIVFQKKPHLNKLENKKITFNGYTEKVHYSYRLQEQEDHVFPDIMSVIIHVNSEKDENILKKLPGIGAARVVGLKENRPFDNLQEVLSAHIGIGRVWAEEWKKGILKGTILFD